MSEQNEQVTFEEAMERLEEVVEKLEEGDVPLEEAIQMFQRGMDLSKYCHERLKKVEAQMDQILNEDGEIEILTIEEEQTSE
ncbi:exodeoxyribonuclease VII small subunit [Alteribacter natronophilus]|uniref:exodeoxyribonuclease VII small subunit n=1 Tax=Alteribacter natronophilus TaxID=2583810 RepID=UPI00110E39AB|nr:exodeoxyribonuclease VII small subunit [Alteribacter natronophilus]TMW73743.1 exodeoxyribonuclease VII small subunit [Alteribacter natronophilus]